MTINPEKVGDRYPGYLFNRAPRNVYWEVTTACDLACKHCRADAQHERDPERALHGGGQGADPQC